jgi:hypothetical protein
MYKLKLLLNVVNAETEAILVSVNKFLHACVKEVCHLRPQPCFDTFHQLLIAEALWSQPVLQAGNFIVFPCCMNSTISTSFLSQRTVAISFLAGRRLFKLFQLVGECDCSLVSKYTNKIQVSSPVTCIMWLRNSSPSLWHRSKNV